MIIYQSCNNLDNHFGKIYLTTNIGGCVNRPNFYRLPQLSVGTSASSRVKEPTSSVIPVGIRVLAPLQKNWQRGIRVAREVKELLLK